MDLLEFIPNNLDFMSPQSEGEQSQERVVGMSFHDIADKIEGARLNYDPDREFSDASYQNELNHFEKSVKINIHSSTQLGNAQRDNLTTQLNETMTGLRAKKRSF